MVKRLRRKGAASSTPTAKAAAASTPPAKAAAASTPPAKAATAVPGPTKSGKFKKKGVKTDPEKLKGLCTESAGIAEASGSAQTPAPKPSSASGQAAGPKPVKRMEGKKEKGEGSSDGVAQTKTDDRKTKMEDRNASKKETMKGIEKKGEGKERKTSRKEMMKGDPAKRGEKRRKTAGKGKEEEEIGPGFIFMCSARTKPECYRNGVFGLPRGKMDVVEKIRPGAKLFLYDFDLKLMYGVYKADTRGGLDLVRNAFDGKFPAQVKFSVDMDCLPVPEGSFKHAIKENYTSKGRFSQELNSIQVQRLLAMFKPIGLSQPAPQHIEEVRRSRIIEDIRRPSDYYEERRQLQHIEERSAPINVHAHPLEDQYKITRSLHPPLIDEPRRGLVLDPYHIQEPQHVPLNYYHQVARSPYHQPHIDIIHERTAAEATVRDPLPVRDHRALPGELAARSEHVDELYRSYKLSTRAMDFNPGASYQTTYEYPTNVYGEGIQRPALTRVSGPSVPVSSRYSFAGPPAY